MYRANNCLKHFKLGLPLYHLYRKCGCTVVSPIYIYLANKNKFHRNSKVRVLILIHTERLVLSLKNRAIYDYFIKEDTFCPIQLKIVITMFQRCSFKITLYLYMLKGKSIRALVIH